MKRLLILLVTMTACIAAWAAEPYAVYTSSDHSLTFYYGTKPSGAFSLNSGYDEPEWYNYGTNAAVQRVVFDPSFAQARPTSTYYWFYGMENLTTITGLNHLNTSEVVNMSSMFDSCKKLTSLDLSNFNTSKVTNMSHMFRYCSLLTSIDLSNFNTSKVKNMGRMFHSCESLTSLDLSSFNTSNVEDMIAMFSKCENLASLDLSSFNTVNVTSMSNMFYNCRKLTSLDLSGFNTANAVDMQYMFFFCDNLTSLDLGSFNTYKVTNMSVMFYGCEKLNTIKVGNAWSTNAVTTSFSMFTNCTSIVGGAGTTYSSSHTDASYAHIDGGPSNPGYLTGATYDLWINGVQVTIANCNNLSNIYGVSGTVTYNPSSKTLTLDHARLSCGDIYTKGAIRSTIDGLTINVIGTCAITVSSGTDMNGMALSSTTITGTDTLGVLGRRSGIAIMSGKTLTINNLHSLISRGSHGIYASNSASTRLVVKGSGTNVVAIGGSGAIRNIGELVLEDGLRITEPVGGYFTGGVLYDASGNVATRATIGLPGDVNGDGTVTAADVTALYDYLLNNDTSHIVNGDQTGDGNITAADVTAVYSVMLSN